MTDCCGQGPSEHCRCYSEAGAIAEAVRVYVQRRVSHAQDAQDITQDALYRLYRSVETLRSTAAFEGWMYRIARAAIVDHYRRAPRRAQPIDPKDLEVIPDVDDSGSAAEAPLVGCLGTLLDHVPEGYRRALELTDLGELTQQQAAEELGLSTSGMKSRVQRGRRLLRAEIRRCCEVNLDSGGRLLEATARSSSTSCSSI